ncbi:MAG: dynamin family protein [Candidatus Kryptoniota bacterium]
MNRQTASEKKKLTTDLLSQICQALEKDFPESSRKIGQIATRVKEELFNLVVVGQFKRGKSTLVNALIGDSILPSAVIPLTSIVTVIKYNSEEKITVHFTDKHIETIRRSQLAEYVTEKLNPNNVKHVESVKIELPSKFLREGLQLVDTPGVGSVYAHNTDVAYKFIPNSDASIFLLTPDQPLSQTELEYLRSIKSSVNKIFFVLNKIDLLTQSDLNEAVAFIVNTLTNELKDNSDELFKKIKLYPISARNALNAKLTGDNDLLQKSGLLELEETLLDFLRVEKNELLINNAVRRAIESINEISFLIKLQLKTLKESDENLRIKIGRFEAFISESIKQNNEIVELIRSSVKKITDLLDDDIEKFKKEDFPKLEADLKNAADANRKLKPSEFSRELDRAIVEIISTSVEQWRAIEDIKIKEVFNNYASSLVGRLNKLVDEIYRESASLFDISFESIEENEIFSEESEFYYMILEDIKPSLEEVSDAIVRSLPRPIAHNLIYKKASANLAIEFDRHLGRIRYDFIQRMDSTVSRLTATLTDAVTSHINKIRNVISTALELRNHKAAETAQKTAQLENMLNQIQSFHLGLSKISGN